MKLIALTLAIGVTSCVAGGADIDEGPSFSAQATTCSARLERYPVAGPHNGGWDANATTFTCPPHSSSNTDYYTASGDWRHPTGHLGNDIFGARGTKIVAARAGVVSNVSNDAIGGLNVSIRDDCGWYTYYAHLDSIDYKVAFAGNRVAAGAALGTLGDTGQAKGTAPHLHFSVFPGDYNAGIDPFPLLSAVESTSCSGAPSSPPQASSGCPYGDGRYCGGNAVAGDPLTLYRCTGGALATLSACPLGCERMPVGKDDRCARGTTCPYGDGVYCGGNGVGGDPKSLYRCSAGRLSLLRVCATSCARKAVGENDTCE